MAMPIFRNPNFRAIGITHYADENVAVPHDCNGLILDSNEFATLIAQIRRFYLATSDEEIWKHNRELKERWQESNSAGKRCRQKRAGFVYVLKADNGIFKIGQTKCIEGRIKQLAVSLPYELQLICSVATTDMDALESALHDRFRRKRKRGEWFELSETDIEYIKGLA